MKTVGIIGGKGIMGKFFADFFRRKGCTVLVSDKGTKLTNKMIATQADTIFFAVPIHLTEKVIKSVLPYIRREQLLLDCTSLKAGPVGVMLKSKASVIGLHPLFRPSSIGFKNQAVVMCKARAPAKTVALLKKWLTSEGARIIQMRPKEHDRLMSVIQVLIHFHTIALGNTFRSLGVSIKKTLKVASPIYRLEMDIVGRIFSQDPLLYGAIEMYNPETRHVTRAFLKETQRLANIVLKKDLADFSRNFKDTADFLGSYKDVALAETNKLLTHLK